MTPSHEPFDKISFSLPHSLLAKIDTLATADRRSRSSWLVLNLEKLLEATPPPAPVSANSPPAAGLRKSDSIGQHSPEPVKKPNRHSQSTRANGRKIPNPQSPIPNPQSPD